MSLSMLGRRYERLLFFAAPLSLGAAVTLFVVFATGTQNERRTARCYEKAAAFLEARQQVADAAWERFVVAKKSNLARITYTHEVSRLLIDVELGSDCYRPLIEEVEQRAKDGPKQLVLGLRQDAAKLFATPIKFSGVEMPERATIGVMGTAISMELTLFASLLQVVLAPLMLLWLGSLYNTRYRETLLIERASIVTEVFPHLINVYPAVRYPEPRRRSYTQAHLRHVFSFVYACVRIGLLLMLIGPAVAAYVASVVLLSSSEYFSLLVSLAALVAIFAFALLLCEILPWHVGKSFPGPPLVRRR